MTSKLESGISSERVYNPTDTIITHLICSICHDILWKPVACQSCETPYCSSCIARWLANNPGRCPSRCQTYTERKCPPLVAKLLAELKIICFYRSKGCRKIVAYEALDKHEIDCNYQPKKCPGCRSEILKKDFDNHTATCSFIEITCLECNLVYRRGDALTNHTENLCLKQQILQLRKECNENKRVMQKFSQELNDLRRWKGQMSDEVLINFNDLSSAADELKFISEAYKGLKWHGFTYAHEQFLRKNEPDSGFVRAFIFRGSQHVAYFKKKASIQSERFMQRFNLISVTACAAYNDGLQLTITGRGSVIETRIHTVKLFYGKRQIILLHWKGVEEVTFESSGGTAHSDNIGTGLHVIITEITISSLSSSATERTLLSYERPWLSSRYTSLTSVYERSRTYGHFDFT